MMDRAEAVHAVLSRGWLTVQPARVQSLLLRAAMLQLVPAGTTIIRTGDPPGGVYGIAAGCVGNYLPPPFGAEYLTHLQHPGDWFGEGPAITQGPRVMGFRSLVPCVLLYVPLEEATALFRTDPEVARALGALGRITLRVAMLTASTLMIPRSDRRVGAVLLRVTGAQYGRQLAPTGDLRLTQSQLGELANASRDRVNRALSQFEAAGWVRLGYNRIAVLQPEPLAAFAFARDDGGEMATTWPELPGEGPLPGLPEGAVGAPGGRSAATADVPPAAG